MRRIKVKKHFLRKQTDSKTPIHHIDQYPKKKKKKKKNQSQKFKIKQVPESIENNQFNKDTMFCSSQVWAVYASCLQKNEILHFHIELTENVTHKLKKKKKKKKKTKKKKKNTNE